MSRKTWLSIFSLLIIVALLAACTPPAPVETEAPAAEQPATQVEQPATETLPEIVVACWSGAEHDNLVKVAAEYEKKTGNKVIVEEIAREAYFDKLTTTPNV